MKRGEIFPFKKGFSLNKKGAIIFIIFLISIFIFSTFVSASRVLWNKLGSDAQVDTSEIGPNGVRSGTVAYGAGKFNNGVNDCDGSNYVVFNDVVTINLFTADLWWKPNINSNSGTVSDIVNNGLDGVDSWGFYAYLEGADSIVVAIEIVGTYTVYRFPISFSSGDLFHLGIMMDKSAGNGLRMRLFKDNVEISPSSITNDVTWTSAVATRDFVIAPVMGTVHGVIDDLVIWNTAKTDFSDRNTEGRTDATPPNVTINTPLNQTYNTITITFNVTALDGTIMSNCSYSLDAGLNNFTMTNASTSINDYNATNSTMSQGSHTVNFYCLDINNNLNNSENVTFFIDTIFPDINMTYPINNTNTTDTGLDINYTFSDININSCWYSNDTYLVNRSLGSGGTCANITNLTWSGGIHNVTIWVNDSANNLNFSSISFMIDTPPTFISVANNPNSDAELDLDVTILVTVNVSDVDSNFDSAILQWKNSTSNWTNVTMVNTTAKGLYTILNASFTPNSSYGQGNYIYRVWANDTIGGSVMGSNTTLNVSWDCTWTATSDLGATSGWDENKWIGNITINNTGDSAFSNNNCSLSFRLTYDLTEGRIYFDNSYLKPSNTYTLSAKVNQTITVNATFLSEIKQEDVIITITESYSRSNLSSKNTTATVVSNQAGPYLYQKINTASSSLYLTPQNFSLEGYLRNLMGSSTVNITNTAYNISFNWSLPSGLKNISGNFSTNFTNISDNELHYNNINISFSDLASMTSGTKIIYLYAQGYNLSGSLIEDANNLTLLTQQVNITFLCYNVSDGIYVTSCGSSDGDYVAPTTTAATTTSSSGGGGGGTSDLTKYEKTEERFELVRGGEQEFNLKIENNLISYKENIKISVSGINSEYIEIIPNEISSIAPGDSQDIIVKIIAPAYFTESKYNLIFLIKGNLISNNTRNSFSEKKVVTLYILEISRENADEILENSKQMVEKMNLSGMVVKDVSSFLEKIHDSYDKTDFQGVKNNYEEIKKIYDAAFSSLEIINDLTEKIKKSEKMGIEITETKKVLYVADVAFKRGDYFLALERLKEAKLTYALEVKGEFNLISTVENYPLESLAVLIGFGIFSLGSSLLVRLRLYKRKLKILQEEEKLLLELMAVVQRQCFEKKNMSMEEYTESMSQYEKKLSETIEDKIRTETKIANLLKIQGKKKALSEERKKLTDLMKNLQDKYLNKGKMETRVYENMLKSYSTRLIEVEEQITFLEAQKALKSDKFFRKIFKFLKFIK